jgi:hypothetical protein
MHKAQSDIVSAVLIVAIALALASSAYMWGIPLIQKRQDTALAERVDSNFNQENINSLPNTIEAIANNGGEKNFYIDANGLWMLNETETGDYYIQFNFATKASKFATDTDYPISLTPGVDCASGDIPNGTLGLDRASMVCVKATRIGDEIDVSYRVLFRKLYEDPFAKNPKGYQIVLVKDLSGLASSTEKTIKISFSTTATEVINGETLIKKKIQILLI